MSTSLQVSNSAITTKSCISYCIAEKFDFRNLAEALQSGYRSIQHREFLHISLESGNVFIFEFGAVVFWDVLKDKQDHFFASIKPYAIGIYSEIEKESYEYSVGAVKNTINRDHFELINDDVSVLMAASHAIGQSVKLSRFEGNAITTIEKTAHIPRNMAEKGETSLSKKEASMMRGQLFLTKSNIILKYDLLDTPEFFWEYPELQDIYQQFAIYLELKARTETLSRKLETIHEMFEMLTDDLKHQHSSKLEWIIIWLIAVEIVIFLINDFIVKA